ncbi:MAG: histidine phosphatase family protein [Candidatus Nitrosocaldaceae archaeon]|nr:MAG: histidine phosphatase family protein [Candidatus Nitrosocaldaceae archaeon]
MALVILMRHGKAGNNVNRILAGRELEFHLTEEGIEQVKEAAKHLRDAGIKAVYASPITRVRETAEIVCKELSLDYVIDDRLIEVDMGRVTGLSYNEAMDRYGDIFSKFYEDKDPIIEELKIERFSNIKKRVDDMLRYIAEKHEDENVLLITHLDPIKAAIANILELSGKALFKLLIPNASLTLLKHSSDYSLLALNVMDISRYMKL